MDVCISGAGMAPSGRKREPEEVRVLRGLHVTEPLSYRHSGGRRPRMTLVEGFRRLASLCLATLAHLLLILLLAEVAFLALPLGDDPVVQISWHRPAPVPKNEAPPARPQQSPSLPMPDFTAVVAPTPEAPAVTEPKSAGVPVVDGRAIEFSGSIGAGLVSEGNPGTFDRRSGRAAAVERYGGTSAGEDAVNRGLRWLAAHQSVDGFWSAGGFGALCPREETCGRRGLNAPEYDHGLTGLALLAFLGAGHAADRGEYAGVVRTGLRWLSRRQGRVGFFFEGVGGRPGDLYGHGIGLCALGEALAMAPDPALESTLERAVQATLRAQLASGGWGYRADGRDKRPEFTLSVWQMMGLKAALDAGVPVSPMALKRAQDFIRNQTQSDGGVRYSGTHVTAGSTAAALFARGRLDIASPVALERGLAYLEKVREEEEPDPDRAESGRHLYSWYYRTLATFQQQGPAWHEWNRSLRPILVSLQRRVGHADGSWRAADTGDAGPVYATALCVLMLEVYYRYLPLQREVTPLDRVLDSAIRPPRLAEAIK